MNHCRHCRHELTETFIDLGASPPSNAYLAPQALEAPEIYYPLKVMVCSNCRLVQTVDYADCKELFTPEYAYFSSVSSSWLEHAGNYFRMITKRLDLNPASYIVELASNDGYLLKHAVAEGIPCLGIDPAAAATAKAAELGIPTMASFFGAELAEELVREGRQADLIIGNNVYAHVPDINDFTRGMKLLLKPEGTITLEFPHLKEMLEKCLFDIIYHEHFSYLSLGVVNRIFDAFGLRVYDVEECSTQGKSYRVYGCHADNSTLPTRQSVQDYLKAEAEYGMNDPAVYRTFQKRADRIKDDFVSFLIDLKKRGCKVAAYGAAAKGNTLINYGGVKADLLPVVFDAAKSKQNHYLPGSHIPILPPEAIGDYQPEYIIILPWNIADEVRKQLDFIREWNGKFVQFIPAKRVF